MPEQVTLVRPDGTLLTVSPEAAAKLAVMGYKEETPEQAQQRAIIQAKADSYQSGEDKVAAFVEGINRGLTFGISDYLAPHLPGYQEGLAERANNNPGYAMGGELIGSVAPVLVSGGTGLAAKTTGALPTSQLARGVESVTAGISSPIARTAARGALEGAAYGVGGQVSHAALSGDPLTAESVLHGIGMGALIGGAAGTLGGVVEARAAKQAAKAVSDVPKVNLIEHAQPEWAAVSSEIRGLSRGATEARKGAETLLASADNELKQLAKNPNFSLDGFGLTEAKLALKEIKGAYNQALKAAESGSPLKLELAIGKLDEASAKMDSAFAQLQDAGIQSMRGNPGKALSDLAQLHASSKILSQLPRNADDFVRMSADKAERIDSALTALRKNGNFQTQAQAARQAVFDFAEKAGIKLDAPSFSQLQTHLKQAARTVKPETVVVGEQTRSQPGFIRKAASWVAGAKGYALGTAYGGPVAGIVAGGAARRLVRGDLTHNLIGAKNAVATRIRSAAGKTGEVFGPLAKAAGPKMAGIQAKYDMKGTPGDKKDPLRITFDGGYDPETDRQTLAKKRAEEFYAAAPNFNDRIYTAIEPIAAVQPELGPALHDAAVKGFQSLLAVLPRDPGVVSGLKSIWRPSLLQAEMMSRQLQVYHDPVGTLENLMNVGRPDPVTVKFLKEYAPALYEDFRLGVLEQMSTPGFFDKTTYRQQIGLSTLIGIPVHSSMRPEHIAASQEIFQQRSQPLPTPQAPGAGGGGQSSKDNPMATLSSRIEQH